MTQKEIAIAFSNGDFEKTYNYLGEHAQWIIVESDLFKGKEAIIENCKQVSSYFKSVNTNFETTYIIGEGKMVVVNGTAEFLKDGKQISFISACDIYEFDENKKIEQITSYCIEKKKG